MFVGPFFILILFVTGCGQENKTVASTPVLVEKVPQDRGTRTTEEALPENWKEVSGLLTMDLKYATDNNFTGAALYPCGRCFLRPEVARRLNAVAARAQKQGVRLRVFDCYRPMSVQAKLYQAIPDATYVADPKRISKHSKGLAVDITLEKDGLELEMGTAFDFFGPASHRDSTLVSKTAQQNRRLLRQLMEAEGFRTIRSEWWHFWIPLDEPGSDWQWSCRE